MQKLYRMKRFFFLFVITFFISCGEKNKTNNSLPADAFEKGLSQQNVQLLDVRTPVEFSSGHIKQALQADWTNKEQFFERIKYVDKDRPVYIYCLSGARSAAAADWMRKNGFSEVTELDGGINAWKKAGKPIEGASSEKQMTLAEYWAQIPADQTVLVDFGAAWCPPCVKMQPVLDEVVKESGNALKLVKVDAGVNTAVMKALNVDAIPVFIVYKNGKETWRHQGLTEKAALLQAIGK